MAIGEIEGNRESLERLQELHREKKVVPFIGAGFSNPVCPGWAKFLEDFYEKVKDRCMEDKDTEVFEELRKSSEDNRFEAMAQILIQCAESLGFKQAMEQAFKKDVMAEKQKKFRLLNKVFPRLKITTNYDCLIEDNHDRHIDTIKGNRREDLKKALNLEIDNTLVKIHGCVRDASTFILTQDQYNNHYGPGDTIDEKKPLPNFLIDLLTNRHLLFIGCSLQTDRWLKLLDRRQNIPQHFAILKPKKDKNEQIKFTQHLSRHMITPIWIEDYTQIEEILELLSPINQQTHLPSHNITFVGREEHLARMEKFIDEKGETGQVQVISGRLFNLEGAGGIGKTTLAIEAANRFHSHFPDGVFGPIRADEHSPQSFAVHLSRLLDDPQPEPPDNKTAQHTITNLLKNKQILIILDNAIKWEDLQYMIPTQTKSTILLTTRDREMADRLRIRYQGLSIETIALEIFSESEAIALFKKMLGKKYLENEHHLYLDIAQSLGFLPIALRQAISLILFGSHYSPEELRDKLASDKRLDLLRKGQKLDPTSDNRPIEAIFDLSSALLTDDLIKTLQYLATCSPGPIPLDFLEEFTKNPDIREQLEYLHTLSWCQRQEAQSQRTYQIHQLVRELIRQRYNNPFAKEFLNLVNTIFTSENIHFTHKDALFPQLEEAFTIAQQTKSPLLKEWIYNLYDFCEYRGHGDFFVRLCQISAKKFSTDKHLLSASYAHKALILRAWGQLEEAMALHKKDEEINQKLRNPERLANSYGNQALILFDWGQLEEATALYRKSIRIMEKLKNKAGIAKSYGNLALILRVWGRLEEAMKLHKKEEKIYEELRNKAGLATTYSNQALILFDWGRLDDAMVLHKKNEEIYKELGNKAGLVISYANQALILNLKGDLDKAIELHKKEEKINKELGNRAGLAASYANQAIILFNWGRLEEAMKLRIKEEEIKREFRNIVGLASCYGNQALILREWGRLDAAMSLHRKEEKIFKKLREKKGLASSYGNQARILTALGRMEEAMELHKEEEQLCIEMKKKEGLASSYTNQALILAAWGRLEEGIELLKKVEKLSKEMGKKAALATSYANQAQILQLKGQLDKAKALYNKSIKIMKELNNRAGIAWTWWNQGIIQSKLGNKAEQIALWKKSIAMHKEIGIPIEEHEKHLSALLDKDSTLELDQ